jgi:signal peptidase
MSNLPIIAVENIKTKLDIVSYVGGTFLPEISNNILLTYLVYLGGPVLSIIYLGLQQCFYWLFPILPNLSWVTKGLIGTLCPIFTLMFLQYFYNGEAKLVKSDRTEENPIGWVVTSIISITIVWFSVGVFPIRPYVIVTGSMEPMIYAGDMVLIKTLSPDEITVGDVIQYKSNDIFIFHRVIEVVEDKRKGSLYQTKGDNNSIADLELVKPEDVHGKVVYTIPKVGWPTMLLKSNNIEDREKYEF